MGKPILKLVMSTANNPQIAVITHMERKIIDSLDDAEYLKALRQIYTLIQLIRKSHREDEILDKIRKEHNRLIGIKDKSKQNDSAILQLFNYSDWFGEAMEILYINAYLTDEGYRWHDPAEGRKST